MQTIQNKIYNPVLEDKFEILSFTVDRNRKIKLNYLTAIIQEAAWKHAQHLDFGPEYLQEKNVAWMLTRFMVEIYEYPEWRDIVTVETWPKTIDGLFYVRDFFIKNAAGKKLGAATSYWLLVDLNSKRPQPPEPRTHVLMQNKDKHGINIQLKKIQTNCNQKAGLVKAEMGDIDLNDHVNSNKYIEWILNTIGSRIPENKPVKSLRMNYIHEVKYNDEIILNIDSQHEDGNIVIEGVRKSDSGLCFQSVIKW